MQVYYTMATHNITCIEHCITVRVLVAAAIWTHFRLYLVASTSYVAVTFSGNLRCMVAVLWLFTLLYIHYKCCLNIIGCTVCVATAMYWRCLNISSVPACQRLHLPLLCPRIGGGRREGAEQSHVEMSSKLFVISPPLPPAAAKKRWRLIGNLLGLRGQRTRFDGAPPYISVHNMSSNIRSIFGIVGHFIFLSPF